jgi:PhnB protein
MHVAPHLVFRGECREAFEFYARALGAAVVTMLGDPGAIVHATLRIGVHEIAGADVPADKYEKPSGMFVLLSVDTLEEGERIFRALSEGGDIRMPMQKTFWSPGFGVVVDRFGTPWEISTSS